MNLSDGLKKFFSFGYIFLVILGILKESVFYNQLNINILNYSSISDILISPVVDIVSHPILLVATLGLFLLAYIYPKILYKKKNTKLGRKLSEAYIKKMDTMSESEVRNHYSDLFVAFLSASLLSFFVGLGWGEGKKVVKKMNNNTIEYNRIFYFDKEEKEEVYMIGVNSSYYFYLTKGNNNIKISPVGAIKMVELANEKVVNH
ncbi:hypothetical protein [Polluticaenibacter yanchengensis]|uniref:DUF3784 domain-containing protein n=1 Tax=Polluticaenibacter yanchengensis TaxID=3014562 RepID=A0ABT4UIJ8_9BACT|nr:hypothetical protein [Chitinophagaceae bacterium LY-5]